MLERFIESSILLIVGLGGVFAALLLMAGMIWMMRSSDEWLNAFRIRRYAKKVEEKASEDEVNDEVIAVIAAATATALRRHVRIRKIRFLGTQAPGAWAVTGRLNVMASHQISKRKT
jgi:Na+-transporting methylmalonyl-CoA/oxaloacetate decarboxylase gamma subunit